MTTGRLSIGRQLGHTLWRDPFVRTALALWLLVSVPYFIPGLSSIQLSDHSDFWSGMILLALVLTGVLSGIRSIGSKPERRFWYLIAAALVATGFAAVGFWSTLEDVAVAFAMDFLYLAFYLFLALAAMTAPHRRDRAQLREAGTGVVGMAITLLWLLAYFVLIPGLFDAARYRTWLPSMYLFVILDLFVLALFVRLFRNAKAAHWRVSFGLLAAAMAVWALLDFNESLSWAGLLPEPEPSVADMLWTLPLAIVLIAARARHAPLAAEPRRRTHFYSTGGVSGASHVTLLATGLFPLMHFAFAMANLVDPELNRVREFVVVGAIMSLGTTAVLERLRTSRARNREQQRRQKAEAALRESEARYRTLVENAPEAIVILDPETGRFVDSNERALELFRISRERLLASGPSDFSPAEQPGGESSETAAREHVERALSGDVGFFDWLHQDSAGQPIHCEVHLATMPSGGKTLVRGSIIDVTDQVALRDQLRESRRMEAIGRLAGGVAHDFNNLLTVINGYSDLALESPDLPAGLQPMIAEIKKAGGKAGRLIGQLLAFGRRQELLPRALDLNGTVRELEALLGRLLGEDLELDLRLDPNLPRIFADPAQVEQVIVNLAVNGRDAMPNGGFLHIETSGVTLDLAYQEGSMRASAGPYARISFRDTGVGMDEATQRRVFEPFFTTKGLGTGLGLATVYGIVAQSRGYITVESAPNRGSTFAVHFPLAPAAVKEARNLATRCERPPSPRGHERILFVEDEESIRSLQSTGLRSLGYQVATARDADQALDLVARRPGGVEVLVTDVVLPGLSGPDLAERVHALDPSVKVIFVSGYTDDLIRRKGTLAKRTPFLQKPFSPIDLAQKIRGVVEAA